MSEPFYVSPRAAFANAAALGVAALTVDASAYALEASRVDAGRAIAGAIAIAVFSAAVIALTTPEESFWNRASFEFSVSFGAGLFLYGLVFISSLYAEFERQPDRIAVLAAAALAFAWQPAERVLDRVSRRRRKVRNLRLVDLDEPNAGVFAVPADSVPRGSTITTESGVEGTVTSTTQLQSPTLVRAVFPEGARLRRGRFEMSAPDDAEPPVIGAVAQGTSLNEAVISSGIDVSATSIADGRLLIIPIRGKDVLYQVTSANVASLDRAVDAGGYSIGAQKLGVWDEAKREFDLLPWLPTSGSPARLSEVVDTRFDTASIGCVPGSRYSIGYKSERAVTYNTAILGILGSGKTTLAQELVARNLVEGVKVLVLDITGQYSRRFESIVPIADHDARVATVNRMLDVRKNNMSPDVDGYFGNMGDFRSALRADLRAFLTECDPIRIMNPFSFNVTTIEGYHYRGDAQLLREATLLEKVAAIAEALLDVCADAGETTKARASIVLEEAHSLVPESTDGLSTADRHSVASAARAVLQGRKYGMGCTLITQRTANVTKTILNQCHTIFALRSYDATGISFLTNYLGDRYAHVLSALPDFHMVAFGEGITSRAPIIMQMNNPEDFDSEYWNAQAVTLRATREACLRAQPTPTDAAIEQDQRLAVDLPDDDDIPF